MNNEWTHWNDTQDVGEKKRECQKTGLYVCVVFFWKMSNSFYHDMSIFTLALKSLFSKSPTKQQNIVNG